MPTCDRPDDRKLDDGADQRGDQWADQSAGGNAEPAEQKAADQRIQSIP